MKYLALVGGMLLCFASLAGDPPPQKIVNEKPKEELNRSTRHSVKGVPTQAAYGIDTTYNEYDSKHIAGKPRTWPGTCGYLP